MGGGRSNDPQVAFFCMNTKRHLNSQKIHLWYTLRGILLNKDFRLQCFSPGLKDGHTSVCFDEYLSQLSQTGPQ